MCAPGVTYYGQFYAVLITDHSHCSRQLSAFDRLHMALKAFRSVYYEYFGSRGTKNRP